MMIDNARYTILLKTLMENPETNKKIMAALSTYPLYEQKDKTLEAYIPSRDELNKAILNRYKYREIGFETVGRFIDELEISMNEIMPYYNGLYSTLETMAEIEDPFGNVNMLETYSETRKDGTRATGRSSATSKDDTSTETSATDTSKIESSVDGSSKNVESATPQSELSISSQNIDSVAYADKATWNKNNSNDSSETTGSSSGTTDTSSEGSSSSETETESETTGTVEHTFHRKGNHGVNTYAHDMIEFRESIINVTQKLINDKRLSELFMLVY